MPGWLTVIIAVWGGNIQYWPNIHKTTPTGSIKSPASGLFVQPFVQVKIKENIKAPHHWPLWGEYISDWWFPSQGTSNAKNVFIRWRHHELCFLTEIIGGHHGFNNHTWGITELQWSNGCLCHMLRTHFCSQTLSLKWSLFHYLFSTSKWNC